MGPDAAVLLPDYEGGCLSGVVPAILNRAAGVPPWMPEVVAGARQVVLLALDGIGWEQLTTHSDQLRHLPAMTGGPITTVVPSTTAAALTSLAVGCPPAEHGIVGYRMHMGDSQVLNVLRWRVGAGDARGTFVPREVQPRAAFGGAGAVAVTRAEFEGTGFSAAHLRGARFTGWATPSGIGVAVGRALRAGDPFVYAYYDGVDKVAHSHGLGEHYLAELAAADRLVGELAALLPSGAVLLVTSDHGQVDVGGDTEVLDSDVVAACDVISGEARFRWLHAAQGREDELVELTRDRYGGTGLVPTREEVEESGWLGPTMMEAARSRLGTIAVVATGTTAYLDPTDPAEPALRSRHGALTPGEMLVPLLAAAG